MFSVADIGPALPLLMLLYALISGLGSGVSGRLFWGGSDAFRAATLSESSFDYSRVELEHVTLRGWRRQCCKYVNHLAVEKS